MHRNISIILALAVASLTLAQSRLVCPIMGSTVVPDSPVVTYAGSEFRFCCPGCDTKFAENPTKAVADAREKGWVIGEFLFNPVTQQRVFAEEDKIGVDWRSIRYYVATEEQREAFLRQPERYVQDVQRESLGCPVMVAIVPRPQLASGYADYQGTRFYFCCAGCDEEFAKDPAKYAGNIGTRSLTGGEDTPAAAPNARRLMPTCAGCAGEARLLADGQLPDEWTLSFRWINTKVESARFRWTLDYRATPRLSVGIERSGGDSLAREWPSFTDNPGKYLSHSDGNSPILPRFTWFITPETDTTPSLVLGFTSDRLSTPRGQAIFLTAAKSFADVPLVPFVSTKFSSYNRSVAFPFGVNWMVRNDLTFQAINDGDYTHLILSHLGPRVTTSVMMARTKWFGIMVSTGM